jgi:hypothetical protein
LSFGAMEAMLPPVAAHTVGGVEINREGWFCSSYGHVYSYGKVQRVDGYYTTSGH